MIGQGVGAFIILVTAVTGFIKSLKATSAAREESRTENTNVLTAVTSLAKDMAVLGEKVSALGMGQAVTAERLSAFDRERLAAQLENREAHGKIWERTESNHEWTRDQFSAFDRRLRDLEGKKA